MKKNRNKLTLKTETLRTLELQGVAGGANSACCVPVKSQWIEACFPSITRR